MGLTRPTGCTSTTTHPLDFHGSAASFTPKPGLEIKKANHPIIVTPLRTSKLLFAASAVVCAGLAPAGSSAHAQTTLSTAMVMPITNADGAARLLASTTLPVVEEDAAALPDDPSTLQQSTPLASGTSTSSTPPAEPSTPETEEQKKAEEHEEAEKELKAEEKQRIAGVVPNFNVVMGGSAVPLSPGQKFDLAFHSIIDPYVFGIATVVAGYSELVDSHTGFGHGPSGYFKRFGAAYTDTAVGTMIGNALLPVVLKQDPRYFRMGPGHPVKTRIIYSALTTFICHGDNGKRQFNYSNVVGNFISGGISNAYYPADERGAGLTIENAAVVTVEGMVGAQVLEFAPDVIDYIHRKREAKRQARLKAAAAQAQPAAPPQP
jgi:hypothetical protein